jgi:hypothetical protein
MAFEELLRAAKGCVHLVWMDIERNLCRRKTSVESGVCFSKMSGLSRRLFKSLGMLGSRPEPNALKKEGPSKRGLAPGAVRQVRFSNRKDLFCMAVAVPAAYACHCLFLWEPE